MFVSFKMEGNYKYSLDTSSYIHSNNDKIRNTEDKDFLTTAQSSLDPTEVKVLHHTHLFNTEEFISPLLNLR